ncbi:MAG: MFS transporter [Alphaproteobacteria bacterium]|nr:MFS transporter [Alphaproteobacteria bacterium]
MEPRDPTAENQTVSSGVPWRVQIAVYATGAFSHSLNTMANVAIPLWIVALDTPPALVGLTLGARYILLVVLSIHGGALMDRMGVRRTMIVLGIAGVVLHMAYPLLPWLGPLILLQAAAGFAGAAGWLGSQVFIGQYMKGSATYTGRLSFSLRVCALIGPPVVGIAWDETGPWGAFAVLALWAAAGLLAAIALPRDPALAARGRASDILPRWRDYADAMRLLLVPAIALVVAVTVIRHSAVAVQQSFYVVWLDQIGTSGVRIGLLMSAWAILGSIASLTAGRLARLFADHWLVIFTVTAQIVLISATPLLPNYGALLVAMALYGGMMGVSQPLMISLMTRRTEKGHQGKSAGLRATANQVASAIMPLVMGLIAAAAGLEASFYIVGAALLAAMVLVTVMLLRNRAP